MAKVTQLSQCRMCGAGKLSKVLSLSPTPVGDYYLRKREEALRLDSFPLDTYQCEECGHVQLAALVDPEYLYTDYIYTTNSSPGLPEHFRNYAGAVCEKLRMGQGRFLVEIGSNDGTLLRAFQEQGLRVLGVDPAREISRLATSAGQPTLNAFFTPAVAQEIRMKHGAADLFIANNVLANVPNPREIFQGATALLKPDGVIVFETGYLRYLAEDCVFDNIYHEHIDYYSIRPLVRFFREIGLQLFDVHVSDSKGSSIRCYVQKDSGSRPVSSVVPDLIEREEFHSYGTRKPYELLGVKISGTRERLHQILEPYKSQGKKVAGFGASVGVTTVLYQFELEGIVDYLLDDNMNRQGLFSPGLGLEVRSPEILYGNNRPDVVLLLAWRYGRSIANRHASYVSKGGRFLQMLPDVEYLTL